MSQKNDKISFHLKYKDAEKDFSAPLEEAWLLLERFFRECIPSFEIAQKLILRTDLQQLGRDLNGIIAISEEGTNLLIAKNKITDNDAICIWLTAQHLGNKLNLLAEESLSKDELQIKLGKSSKITSTRVGELVKNGLVSKIQDDRYKITTFGIMQTQKEAIPKVKAKTGL